MTRSDSVAPPDAVRAPEGAPAEARGPCPRPRGRDTWGGAIGLLLFGGLWCVLPLVGIARSVSDLEREWRLPREGVTTDGQVVARRVETDAEGSSSHHLTLAYDAPAGPTLRPRRFLHDVRVGAQAYEDLPPGSRLPMRYVRSAPASVRLAADSGVGVVFRAGLVIVLLTMFTVPGLLFVVAAVVTGTRLWRLAWGARFVSGQVEECWLNPLDEGAAQPCVTFRFTPPGGSLQRATEINAEAHQRLRPGGAVMVEYLPRCPTLCRLAQW